MRPAPDLTAALHEILTGWDPIGVHPGGPDDEYDCLIPDLVTLVVRGVGPETFRRHLEGCLEDHFGLDPGLVGGDVCARLAELRSS